jgi:hypothetical protein
MVRAHQNSAKPLHHSARDASKQYTHQLHMPNVNLFRKPASMAYSGFSPHFGAGMAVKPLDTSAIAGREEPLLKCENAFLDQRK